MVSHEPLRLNLLHSSRGYWQTIERGIDRQPEMDTSYLHIGRTARTTLRPPRTERSIFPTLLRARSESCGAAARTRMKSPDSYLR